MVNLEVGQVIYTIITDKQIIIPTKVAEQVLKKTLEGEETHYKVLLPNKKKQLVSLDRLEKYYLTLNEAQEFLTKNAKDAIDKMIRDAVSLEEDFFVEKIDVKSQECNNDNNEIIINQGNNDELQNKNQSNDLKIDLGDGTVGKININSLSELNIDPNSVEAFEEKDLKKK